MINTGDLKWVHGIFDLNSLMENSFKKLKG